MTPLLDHALSYYNRGLAVVPIEAGKKKPLVMEWETNRLSADDLKHQFTNGHGDKVGGIGIITGHLSGNLAILDFDGQNWQAAFEHFTHSWDELANAPTVETGSGKRHLWLKVPNLPIEYTNQKFHREVIGHDKKGNPIYAQTIEFRGNRSNNLAPPSLHPSGGYYQWVSEEAELLEVDFHALYDWLKEWEQPEESQRQQETPMNSNGRYATLPRRTLEFMAFGAEEGNRNDELYEAAKQYAASGRPIETALEDLKPVALRIGLEEKESEATIKSGYSTASRKGFKPIQTGQASDKPTHDELRDRWIEQAGLIVYGLGDFHRYDKGLWLAFDEALIRQEILEVIEAAKSEGIKPTGGLLLSVCELTRVKLAIGDSRFNAHPDYLVCGNGTLHIPGRTLGEHSPKLYATSGVSYNYDPEAKAPAWLAFLTDLAESIGQDVVSFLQEIAGYALTTDTSHEIALWLYGPPGSGKSTALEGFKAMLGNRAGLLGLADIERNRFALDKLPGKTLVVSSEQPSDFIASTHILNALISGETIRVDRKFRDAIEITPRCKIAWAMNELPRVSDPNSGLFRRVKVVSFPVIPEADRDPMLKETIKTEGAGILNWALDGLDRLRKRGRFEIPQAVMDATENFRQSNDIPARFIEECCLTGNDAQGEPYRAQAGQLYKAYKEWCNENGHKPQSSTKIASDWERLGFEKRRPGGIKHWFGVGLRA